MKTSGSARQLSTLLLVRGKRNPRSRSRVSSLQHHYSTSERAFFFFGHVVADRWPIVPVGGSSFVCCCRLGSGFYCWTGWTVVVDGEWRVGVEGRFAAWGSLHKHSGHCNLGSGTRSKTERHPWKQYSHSRHFSTVDLDPEIILAW